jgi:hypothetical protein
VQAGKTAWRGAGGRLDTRTVQVENNDGGEVCRCSIISIRRCTGRAGGRVSTTSWATFIAQQLNQETLPPSYFAESEISVGPELEIDVATVEPPRPKIEAKVEFFHLDSYEIGYTRIRAERSCVLPSNWSAPPTRTGPGAGGRSPPSVPATSSTDSAC